MIKKCIIKKYNATQFWITTHSLGTSVLDNILCCLKMFQNKRSFGFHSVFFCFFFFVLVTVWHSEWERLSKCFGDKWSNKKRIIINVSSNPRDTKAPCQIKWPNYTRRTNNDSKLVAWLDLLQCYHYGAHRFRFGRVKLKTENVTTLLQISFRINSTQNDPPRRQPKQGYVMHNNNAHYHPRDLSKYIHPDELCK